MNTLPPSIIPARRRVRRKRTRGASATALTLVAATYDPGTSVTLTFDRAISAAALDASQISVYDAAGTGWYYNGTGAGAVAGNSVTVTLLENESAEGPTRVSATALTGIVAVDDGGTWAGVTDLELPFP
jgi:hypothetical protein